MLYNHTKIYKPWIARIRTDANWIGPFKLRDIITMVSSFGGVGSISKKITVVLTDSRNTLYHYDTDFDLSSYIGAGLVIRLNVHNGLLDYAWIE